MVARNDDNREASTTGAEPSAAPAGLSWGRRQPISQDISAARRGQVKGLFGGDPGSPAPPAPAAPSPEAAEPRSASLPLAEPDPTDSFFGAEQSIEAGALLENADVVKTGARRAAARAWPLPGPSEAESDRPARDSAERAEPAPAATIPPLPADPSRPISAFPPAVGPERETIRPRPSPPGRSGMRHKRVEPEAAPVPDEARAAEAGPRLFAAPMPPRSQRPADVAAAQLMAADREPPVHSPRWVLTGSILLAALVVGGAFMFWSLRGSESSPPSAPASRSAPSAPPSRSVDDVVTWSPQQEHSHEPQDPAAPTDPAVPTPADPAAAALATPPPASEPALEPAAAAKPSLEPALDPALAAQPAQAPAELPAAEAVPPEAIEPAQSEEVAQAASDAAIARSWLQVARRKLASDDAEGAEAAARKSLASEPQSLPATEVLARALIEQDRGRDALPVARKLVQRAAKRVPYRLLLGDVLLMTGDEAAARREWQRALELAPGDAEIERRLGPVQ
jgi:hypothetical protein